MRSLRRFRSLDYGSLLLSITGLCIAANSGFGQPAQGDSTPRVWLLTFKKGDVGLHRGKTTITGRSPDGKSETNLVLMPTEKIEVRDVNTKGEATIVDTPVALEVIENGKSQKIEGAAFSSTTMIVSKAGLLLKTVGDTDSGSNPLIAVQNLLINLPVPVTPVKAGDSWKTELDNPLVPGKKTVMLTTFMGTEIVYGIETVKTKFTLSVPMVPNAADAQTIQAEGVRNIDINTGRLVRSDVKIQNVEYLTPKGIVKGRIEASSFLIVPGINDKDKQAASPKK